MSFNAFMFLILMESIFTMIFYPNKNKTLAITVLKRMDWFDSIYKRIASP